MNDVQVWTELSDFLVKVVSTIVLTLICWAIKNGIAWLQAKTKNVKVKAALDELERVVIDGIFYMEQTTVKAFKENGCWNEGTQAQVLAGCRSYVLNTLTEEAKLLLTEDNKTSIEELVRTKIEAQLGMIHEGKPKQEFIDIPLEALDPDGTVDEVDLDKILGKVDDSDTDTEIDNT